MEPETVFLPMEHARTALMVLCMYAFDNAQIALGVESWKAANELYAAIVDAKYRRWMDA